MAELYLQTETLLTLEMEYMPLRLPLLHHCAWKGAVSDHRRLEILGNPQLASRSGEETKSHPRGLIDFEFQTGNPLITLQK